MKRLLPPPASEADIARMSELCDLIEDTGDEAALAEWNAKAGRRYVVREFKTYYGAVSKRTFVEDALSPAPHLIDDLRFDEAVEVVPAITQVTISEAQMSFALAMLEHNLPGANLSDLVYWPDQWFGDATKLHIDLSPEHIVAYAMARSGRALLGAPEIDLPYPLPS